jgi:hypothetical protein
MHRSTVHRAVGTFTRFSGDRQRAVHSERVHAQPVAVVNLSCEDRSKRAAQRMPDVDLGEVSDVGESSLPPLIDRRQPRPCSRPSGAPGCEPGNRGLRA